MFLVIFSSHDLPTTEKVLKFMQMRAWYINLRSAVWVVGTESPRLTARWPNVTLEHAVVAFLQSLQKMTLKELLGLAPGGTGGRGGPSASEDQGAENAWQNIGALENLISPSRRRSSRGPASWTVSPDGDVVPRRPASAPPELPPPMLTGNRIMNMPLLDDFLQKNCPCPECAKSTALTVAKKILAEFSERLAPKLDPAGGNAVKNFTKSFLRHMKADKAVADIISQVNNEACLRLHKEQRSGLASTLTVKCSAGHEATLSSAHTVYPNPSNRRDHYEDSNIRLTAGLINIGRGADHGISLLNFMDIHINDKSFTEMFQRCESLVGSAYKTVAKDSCAHHCKLVLQRNEKDPNFYEKIVPENEHSIQHQLPHQLVGADVTIDAGWHGRASGHSYSSNGGTFAMLDGTTSKCLAYSVHCRHCKKCDEWRKANPNPPAPAAGTIDDPLMSPPLDEDGIPQPPQKFKDQHNCAENHYGSSPKSMESTGAIMCLKMLSLLGLFAQSFSMDDDSAVVAHCGPGEKSKLTGDLEFLQVGTFYADPSHRTRCVGNHAYNLVGKVDGEQDGDSRFTKQAAEAVKKVHSYVLRSFLGDPPAAGEPGHRAKEPSLPGHFGTKFYNVELLQRWFYQGLEHLFGNHTAQTSAQNCSCSDFFDCPALKAAATGGVYNPTWETNVVGHRGSMAGRYLKGDALYAKMKKEIFDRYGSLDVLRESCHAYSTQANEALNRKHASKAPKESVYSRSASYTYRIAASIAEYNDGFAKPHFDMFALLGIQPGEHCTAGLTKKDSTRKRKRERRVDPTVKARRRHGSKAKSRAIVQAEQTEQITGFGAQYQSGIRNALAAAQDVDPAILVCMLELIVKIEAGDTLTAPTRKSKKSASGGAGGVATATGCKCGSTTHLRTSHSDCPMNKKNLAARPAK